MIWCLVVAGCSASPTTVASTVTIGEDEWSADTVSVGWSSSGVPIRITNATSQIQTFVVFNLSEGAVEDLPLTPNGQLDFTMAGLTVCPRPEGCQEGEIVPAEPGTARFDLIHPEGVGPGDPLPELSPGESVTITIGPSGGPPPGTYVVMSGEPDAVSRSKIARFEIGEPTS
jgi:hypothetical protein